MSISKANRLPLRTERVKFSDLKTKKIHTLFFTLLIKENTQTSQPRIGMIISKKISSLAVDRNKVRRLFTESIRPLIDTVKPLDYLVIFTKDSLKATYQDFQNEIKKNFPS